MQEKLIIVIAILLIVAIVITCLKLCSNFRDKVYKQFLIAEKEVVKGRKMDYVVSQIYPMLPTVVTLIISETTLRQILQKMFNVVKDFLNDGKLNRNEKEGI